MIFNVENSLANSRAFLCLSSGCVTSWGQSAEKFWGECLQYAAFVGGGQRGYVKNDVKPVRVT